MRYWIDTEFIEDGKTIELISLGIVAEDGRDHYFQSTDCDLNRANDWVKANVLPHLEDITEGKRLHAGTPWQASQCPRTRDGLSCSWFSKHAIAESLCRFCDPERYGKPEFWGYYADYDWVVMCQLFGTMMDLPKGWPMYCRDIKQWCDDLGNPKLPEQDCTEHHALADAWWNRKAWLFLRDYLKGLPDVIGSRRAQDATGGVLG